MKKQRKKYKLEDRRVLSLHETTIATIDAKKEKLLILKHHQNIDTFFEGRRTVWTEHATFNIFILNHGYIIPNILEIVAFHSPTATDDHIYVQLPSVLRELDNDDLKSRIQSQKEKVLNSNRSCSNQEIYRKCANDLIVKLLLNITCISSNHSTLSRNHSIEVSLSSEKNNVLTCEKPAELIPVEIVSRKNASRIGRNIVSPLSNPLQAPSFNNAIRRQITSPAQTHPHMSSISEYDSGFSESTSASIGERDASKKDRPLSSAPIPTTHESRLLLPPIDGSHLSHQTILSRHIPPQPQPRPHSLLPSLPTLLAADSQDISLFTPDEIETSCALKIKEIHLPPCVLLNPVLAIPPRRRVPPSLPEPDRNPFFSSSSFSLPSSAQAVSLFPPSASQSYHEKSHRAVEKDKDKESVHFSWGPGRMDTDGPRHRRRQQPRSVGQ